MIDNVISFTETEAQDIHGMAQLVTVTGSTILVVRDEGISSGYVVLRNMENGRAIICYKTRILRVVTNVQDWDSLSESDRLDIEIDAFGRGL